MSINQFTRHQFLPITIVQGWEFFSNPANLSAITPPSMNFKILNPTGYRMYPGQIITYKVNILPAFRVTWVTEISQVKEPFFFVDEQRAGPYKLWHHQHHFKEVDRGIEMTDIITYGLPLGFLGKIANRTFVKKELERIFAYRHQVLTERFPSN